MTKSSHVQNKPGPNQKPINLALQGGGSHGAFTWGVLDYLLEDGRLFVEAISATSAGTMNACAYAYGMHQGGAEKARQTLHDFWWKVHDYGGSAYSPFKNTPWEHFMMGKTIFGGENPAFFMFDSFTRMFSPYQTNPFDFNPLRDVLEKTIDFEALKECDCMKLYISTTHVKTGKVRIFGTEELSTDVALASAALPYVFKAVTINGEDYWDGGYSGNPALFPLYYDTQCNDIMIVHINPLEIDVTPTDAAGIVDRINEISFNSSLLKDMRAISFVKKLVENDMLRDEYKDKFRDVLMHSVRADEALEDLSVASKFDSSWSFLTSLRDLGRETMKQWLADNFDKIGKEDSVDIHSEFLYSISRVFDETIKPKKKIASRTSAKKKKT
jgi:NTE family protein